MTDNKFFPGLDEHLESHKQQMEQNYDARLLSKLFKLAGIADEEAKHEVDDFGFDWFNEAYDAPIKLHARKLLGVHASELLHKNFMKGNVCSAYFELLAEYGKDKLQSVGMVFPTLNDSNWIIHNSPTIPYVSGTNVIIREGVNESFRLTIIRFEFFLEGLLRVWQP